MKQKLIRITSVPQSLGGLLKGQMKFMSQYYDIIGISSNGDGQLEEFAVIENIKTIPVEMTRKITPFKDIVAVYKLYKIFKKEQPFIVHTHTPKAGTLGMLAAKLAGVPNRLHTIAGLPLVEARGLKRVLLNLVEKITYSCATIIYPNSIGLKKIILEHQFTKPEKLKVLANGSSNGIDTSYYNPQLVTNNEKTILQEELGIKPSDFVFVFVGRLVTDKGINELVEAFINLNMQIPHIKLLLVGAFEDKLDPLSSQTINLINENKNILHVGWQDDVRPYFAISNCLVFPSYREGFPNVVLQAGAMKLPCIVTNINGCNEIISEPDNGIIIPVKNTEAIYQSMERLIQMSKKDHETMGEISRNTIVSKFEQRFVWKSILEEYQKIGTINLN
ncbi:MAG: glycosyltransferase family 4 protein [Flavobacteriaceae bacterium]|nr:glycosyltransferase family 4 protein [Flavobacteriaceae bacterium]